MSDDIFDDFPCMSVFDLSDTDFDDPEEIVVNFMVEFQCVDGEGRACVFIEDLETGEVIQIPVIH